MGTGAHLVDPRRGNLSEKECQTLKRGRRLASVPSHNVALPQDKNVPSSSLHTTQKVVGGGKKNNYATLSWSCAFRQVL